MTTYIQLHFTELEAEQQEILIALLSGIGFEAFEQGQDFLHACIPEKLFNEEALSDIRQLQYHPFTKEIIVEKNWNETWEKSFEPVIIEDFCAIRANFHAAVKDVLYEIIITPKMSFGTGHHATTFQVIRLMKEINFSEQRILDFGTGTGILAILAEKMGGRDIVAIDNDEWSMENARENCVTNNCKKISLIKAERIPGDEPFDVILANINRHVILEHLSSMAKHLRMNSVVILSGLLKSDQRYIAEAAFIEGLVLKKYIEMNDWIALYFTKGKTV